MSKHSLQQVQSSLVQSSRPFDPQVQSPPSSLLSPQNPLSPVSGKAALQADVVLHDGGGGGVLVVTLFLQQAQAPLNGDPGDLPQDSSKTQDPLGKASASSLL